VLTFKEHARSIHAKAPPTDPSCLRVSFDPPDARSCITHADAETNRHTTHEKHHLEIREWMVAHGALSASQSLSLSLVQGPPWEVLTVVGDVVFLVLGLSIGIIYAFPV